jgi:hypothetical protein
MTRFNPAAFNPRLGDHESARREGLPPAAEVRALYQADSRIVKGQGTEISPRKSGNGGGGAV